MTVYLNSISKYISLNINKLSKNARYEIYNGSGKLIQIGSIRSQNQALNLNLVGQDYTLKIINGKEVIEQNIF